MARLLFHVGGPTFHPVAEQAREITEWLRDTGHTVDVAEGREAFRRLGDCDLFVLMGLFHSGDRGCPYEPLSPDEREAFARYVASGRPVLAHHGGIASYDDWPDFMRLVGFGWVWGRSRHSPFGTHVVRVVEPDHPVMAGMADFVVEDEVYYDLWMDPRARVHAVASWDGLDRPMVCTLEGRSEGPPGAGRVVYLANGHDLRAFRARWRAPGPPEAPLRRLWRNAVAWLVG